MVDFKYTMTIEIDVIVPNNFLREKIGDLGIIDWFLHHVNLFGVILCQDIRKLHLLYVHMYFSCVVV